MQGVASWNFQLPVIGEHLILTVKDSRCQTDGFDTIDVESS